MDWTGKFNKEKIETLPMNCGRRINDSNGFCAKGLLAMAMVGLEELKQPLDDCNYDLCVRVQTIKKKLPKAVYDELNRLEVRMIKYEEDVRQDLLELVKDKLI